MSEIETELQRKPPNATVSSLRVDVIEGPDQGRFTDGHDPISIGAARDNHLVLSDPTVSRYHLEISVHRDGIAVVDLGSTNGAYIGTVRIERALVQPRTPIKLGNTTVRFGDAVRGVAPTSGEIMEKAGVVAGSPQMLRLLDEAERIAPVMTSVLIVGESGTGKEVIAQALHTLSSRANEPFVTVDCGALTTSLISSELFGHEKGAFTGAELRRKGAFERAGDGTLFLDEIGELPLADQAALLGVLERRRFRRVGGTAEIEVGARIIAATNRDLRSEVNSSRFRHDLYHRLAVVVMRLPPLRERPEDVMPLVEMFTRELGADAQTAFPSELLERWRRHAWPGNVRELRNAVEAALVVGVETAASAVPLPTYKIARASVVSDFERSYLTQLLAACDGNVAKAARTADMDRSHLIDLLTRHKLKV